MSVQSTFFGVTKLTDEDSAKFHRQVVFGRPTKTAIASLKRGKVLLRTFEKQGYVKIKVKEIR